MLADHLNLPALFYLSSVLHACRLLLPRRVLLLRQPGGGRLPRTRLLRASTVQTVETRARDIYSKLLLYTTFLVTLTLS